MALNQVKSTTSAPQHHKCKGKTHRGSHRRRDSQAYWEARLNAAGLGMDRGLYVGSEHIIYGQDIVDLDFFASQEDKHFELRPETGERLETESETRSV